MRLSLLLFALLAAPSWAQDYDAFVISQGAFGAQNSSVVEVNGYGAGASATPLVTGRIYTQGAEIIGDRLYLTAGDSFSGTSRLDVIDVSTGALVGQVTDGLRNPRYFAEVASNKAYVTNQDYSGTSPSFVTPVDLATNTAGTPIVLDGTPEGVTLANGRAVVALGAFGGKDSLAVLNPQTDTLVGYVDIECAARFVIGTFSYAWAVCTDTDEAVAVDPTTLDVVRRVAIGEDVGDPNGIGQDATAVRTTIAVRRPSEAAYEGDAVLISTATGLVLIDGESGDTVLTVPIADADTRPITALGAIPGVAAFYLGRPDPANPFGAEGTVTVHGSDGALLTTVDAGVFPSYVALNPILGTDAIAGPGAGGFGLALAGPNPARQRTVLALTLDRPADVRVELFDMLGRTVARLAEGTRGAETHRIDVETSALAPGSYLVRAVSDGWTATLPLVIAR